MRPWLAAPRSLEALNSLAAERDVRTESGQPVRFVPPVETRGYYEISVFDTGRVATRPENLHDWFNALTWLAFPQAKARINALHAATIPLEGAQRGRFRDLLTLFDEGGVLVVCDDRGLLELLEGCEWKTVFWQRREQVQARMRFLIFGHAVLEQALAPWPGITCKALCIASAATADASVADWLKALPPGATPRVLPSIPVFGYPGWLPESLSAAFYDDTRYFRPRRG